MTVQTRSFERAGPTRAPAEAIAILHSKRSAGLEPEALAELATAALHDLKGVDVTVLDIGRKSSIADAMIIATGTSVRHVGSLAESVRLAAKEAGHAPLGVEGDSTSDWVLVDLGDVIVHVMTDEKREFYALEKLWAVDSGEADAAPAASAAGRPALHSV